MRRHQTTDPGYLRRGHVDLFKHNAQRWVSIAETKPSTLSIAEHNGIKICELRAGRVDEGDTLFESIRQELHVKVNNCFGPFQQLPAVTH